jgi:serine/threonine protein kinase
MGSVYEAVHDTIERHVALKLLNPEHIRNTELLTRFFNEARAVNRVNHPGLVQIFDHGQLPDGTAYIVMELLTGETLGQRVRRLHRRLRLQDTLRLLQQVTSTLAATHAKGIVHRDLKPDNIMIVADAAVVGGERTKVLDFGIAKGSHAHYDGKVAA